MNLAEKENWITRLNYSKRGKGALGASFTFLLPFMILTLPDGPRGDVLDLMLSDLGFGVRMSVIATNSLAIVTNSFDFLSNFRDRHTTAAGGFGFTLAAITYENDGLPKADILAGLSIGTLAWMGIDTTAKALYDSGKTKALYRLMRIQDRRLNPTTS